MLTAVLVALLQTPSATFDASIELSPDRALPGETVTFDGTGPAGYAEDCAVTWDGGPAPGSTCRFSPDGTIDGSVTVQGDAVPGTHTIDVCSPSCSAFEPGLGAPSPSGSTSVSPVVALPGRPMLWRATAQLLVLSRVPDVRDMSVADAKERIGAAGLRVEVVPTDAPDDARVVTQDPGANTSAEPDSLITLTAELPTPTPTFVTVPDLRNHTVEAAHDELAGLGLTLDAPDDGYRLIENQQPLPGERVRQGTTVVVTLLPVSETASSSGPTSTATTDRDLDGTSTGAGTGLGTSAFVAALAVLAVACLGAAAVLLHRHGVRWLGRHVNARVGGTDFIDTSVTTTDGPPTTVVEMQPHTDVGDTTLVEEKQP